MLNIATTTATEYSGSGALVALDFKLLAPTNEPLPVSISRVLFNGGDLFAGSADGAIRQLVVYSLSGDVTYWSDANLPVPGTITAANRQATTNSNSSAYMIDRVPVGEQRVTLAVNQPINRAIRVFDASLVLGMSVGAVEITDLNRGVADVDNSGDINSVDARLIARYAVELDQLPFPTRHQFGPQTPRTI